MGKAPIAAGPLEASVGRTDDDGTDASGLSGTYGCACVSRNALACAELRYGYRDQQERCECLCHNWEDDDDDE